MFTPTPTQTRRFWRQMCAHWNTRVVPKRQAWEMRAAGRVLETLQIMPADAFMYGYTTVWGHTIYPCFTIGTGSPDQLWSQIVTCTHEHQHVVQAARDGYPRYIANYLLSSRKRALYEAEAYGCNLEMHHWRGEQTHTPRHLAAKLERYGCSGADIRAAETRLRQIARDLLRGTYRSEAVAVALRTLNDAP